MVALLTAACGGDGERASTGGAGAGAGRAGAGGAGASGTGGAGQGGGGGSASGTEIPFDIYRELQQALRQSPDHLEFEAQRRVAAREAEALYRFVHESFATRPSGLGTSRWSAQTATLWGRRAMMRGGTGTPRDKCELLVELLTKAGFTARVVVVPVDKDSYWARVYRFAPARTFQPVIDAGRLSELRALLGMAATVPPPGGLEEGPAKALADKLLGLLPADLKAQELDGQFTPQEAPMVELSSSDGMRVLDPNDPEATFAGVQGKASLAGAAEKKKPALEVRLRLVSIEGEKPLLEAKLPAEELVGRRLSLGFVSPDGLEAVIGTRLGDLRTFVPVVAVASQDLDETQTEALAATGHGFTLGGEVIEVKDEQTLTIQGVDFHAGPDDPALLARVVALEASASGASYPVVRSRITARDKDGLAVEGLSGAAFVLTDEGKPVRAALGHNLLQPPRVVFILDKSESIPEEFRQEKGAQLVRDFAALVKAELPDARFQMAGGGELTQDMEKLYEAALAYSFVWGSPLWDALASAAALEPTFVVMISDGDYDDVPNPVQKARVGRIGSSAILAVGNVNADKAQELASASNGAVYSVASLDEAKAAMLEALRQGRDAVYGASHRAPDDGSGTRQIKVRLRGRPEVDATASYQVPAQDKRVTPARLGGLLLELKLEGEECTRILGGIDKVRDETPDSVFDDAVMACFSTFELRFESDHPSAAMVLDDLVQTRLSFEPLFLAARQGNSEALRQAFFSGSWEQLHGDALALATLPVQNDGHHGASTSLRAVLGSFKPRLDGPTRASVDLLPLGPARFLQDTPQASFQQSLRATAALAVAEAALHASSTLSLLDQEPLVYLPKGILDQFPSLSPDRLRAWDRMLSSWSGWHKLVPASGEPIGAYAIHKNTGAVVGLLPDGSGGGINLWPPKEKASWEISLLNWASALGGLLGILSLPGAIWLIFGKAIIKKVLQATLIISTLDAPPAQAGLDDALKDIACDSLKSILGEVLGKAVDSKGAAIRALGLLSKVAGNADALQEAILNKAIFECF